MLRLAFCIILHIGEFDMLYKAKKKWLNLTILGHNCYTQNGSFHVWL